MIAVVAWHAKALGSFDALDKPAHPDIVGVLYLNGLVLAVPFFLTVSLFLYARSWRPDAARLGRRIRDLAAIAAFWIAVTWMARGIGGVTVREVPVFIVSGGFTIFYFLVALVWLTVLVDIAMRLRLDARAKIAAVVTLTCVTVMLLEGPIANVLPFGDQYVLNYWSPLNFLVYAPVAVLLAAHHTQPLTARAIGVGVAMFALIAAAEWVLLAGRDVGSDTVYLPVYSRPSVMVGAALIVAVLSHGTWRPPSIVVWLSGLSLGIYCVHPLVLEHAPAIWPGFYDRVYGSPMALFTLVLSVTVALVWVARTRRVI